MKNRLLVAGTMCVSFFLLFSQIISMDRSESKGKLELRLSPGKTAVKVGEVAYFTVSAVNIGDRNLSFSDTLNEGSGHLHVLISQDGKSFRQYNHSAWGLDDSFRRNIDLSPGEKVTRTLSLLWNKPPSSSSSIAADVLERASEGKILTDYAFPQHGTYYVKAIYSVNLTTQEQPVLLESRPIRLTVEEALGDDLEVWNKIKSKGDFAYFIHEGDVPIPSYKSEERARFLAEVTQILTDHPNSFYSQSLRQSLDKFRASEATRQESLQKLQKQEPY